MAIGIRGNRWKNTGTLAAAGTVITNAAALSSTVTVVSGADDAKGVILPTPTAAGETYLVYQSHATSGLKVYPPVGGTINDGSANAAVVTEGKSLAIFVSTSTTNYAAMFTANS